MGVNWQLMGNPMNIFATSNDPIACALALDDRRLNKMVLETAQLICTACHVHGFDYRIPYKSTHINHPCAVWAATNIANLEWLCDHFDALCQEYRDRMRRSHSCEAAMQSLVDSLALYQFDDTIERTPLPNCAANAELGITYKHLPDVHHAYRKYLAVRIAHEIRAFVQCKANYYPKWTNKSAPEWLQTHIDNLLVPIRH